MHDNQHHHHCPGDIDDLGSATIVHKHLDPHIIHNHIFRPYHFIATCTADDCPYTTHDLRDRGRTPQHGDSPTGDDQ